MKTPSSSSGQANVQSNNYWSATEYAPEVRRIIYTTNAIESLHSQVRKAIRNKGHFPSDEAATKLIYLALKNIMAKWKRPPREWHAAKAQLAIQFGERFTMAA